MIQERKYRDMRSVGLVSYGQCLTVRRGGCYGRGALHTEAEFE